jgi:hypothetical protein
MQACAGSASVRTNTTPAWIAHDIPVVSPTPFSRHRQADAVKRRHRLGASCERDAPYATSIQPTPDRHCRRHRLGASWPAISQRNAMPPMRQVSSQRQTAIAGATDSVRPGKRFHSATRCPLCDKYPANARPPLPAPRTAKDNFEFGESPPHGFSPGIANGALY